MTKHDRAKYHAALDLIIDLARNPLSESSTELACSTPGELDALAQRIYAAALLNRIAHEYNHDVSSAFERIRVLAGELQQLIGYRR